MSGLVGFFRDFLPPGSEDSSYGCRLEERGAPPANDAASDRARPVTIEFTPEPLNFREWRHLTRESLKVYFQRRMASGDEEDDDDDDDDDDELSYEDGERNDEGSASGRKPKGEGKNRSEDGCDDSSTDTEATEGPGGTAERLASQEFDTQQLVAEGGENRVPNTDSSSVKHSRRKRHRRIPDLSKAIHSIRNPDYLDLFTKDLSLDLCKVTRVWRLREAKRGIHFPEGGSSQNHSRRACPVLPGRMPRVAFGRMQDDGPLSPIYKHVLSLELEPLAVDDRAKRGKDSQRQSKKRIRIFFYNVYAKAVWEWMEDTEGSSAYSSLLPKKPGDDAFSFILSLSRIPAVCVFPYAKDPQDWLDHDRVSDYCLCVGDTSTMKVAVGTEDPEAMRVDSPELELRMARAAGAAPELVLSRDVLHPDGPSMDALPVQDHRLLGSWKAYQEQQQEATLAKRAATDPTAPHNIPVPQQLVVPPPMAAPVATGTTSATGEPTAATAPVDRPTVPPNRPLPPPPVNLRRECPDPMSFEGPARKRPRATGQRGASGPPTAPVPSVSYSNLVSLPDIFAMARSTGNQNRVSANLYAVVLGFTAPSQTKRGDWMLTANLVDETCTNPYTLVVFTKRFDQLPKLGFAGDVLRIHRVFFQEWKGDVQLLGRMATSFVVIRKRKAGLHEAGKTNVGSSLSSPWIVAPTASNEFYFVPSDETRAQCLWHWGQRLLTEQQTINPEHCFSLGNIAALTEEDEARVQDRDLTVMISAIIPYPIEHQTSVTPRGFLRVWDGTGEAPSDPMPIETIPTKESKAKGEPSPEALTRVAAVINGINNRRRDSNAEASTNPNARGKEALSTPQALCGKVANVVVWEQSHWNLIKQNVEIGSFVRMRNVDVRKWQQHVFRSLMVHSKSWLSPLPDESYDIQLLLEMHEQRVRLKQYNPTSGLLPIAIPPPRRPPSEPTLEPATRAENSTPEATPAETTPVPVLKMGKGLAAFISAKTRTKRYKGVVQLLQPTIPEFNGNLRVYCIENAAGFAYRCVITVADASTFTKVLVPDPVAETIFGVPASKAVGGIRRSEPFDSDLFFEVTIQAVQKGGQRFFVLMGISEALEEN